MDDVVVDQINEAAKDDAPVLAEPYPNSVELLRGLHDPMNDTWHSTATVRELNGEDEEALAVLGNKDDLNYTEYMTSILERAVVSIGSLPGSFDVVNKLILPDRDLLFLQIIKATYGIEREVKATCSACGEQQNIVIELEEDFPVKGRDRDLRSPIEVPLKHGVVEFRIPNGEMTTYAVKHGSNTPEVNTLLIAQCVITKDETSLEERTSWARSLNVADRRKVDSVLSDAVSGVGPQLEEVETRCVKCKAEMPLLMDWVSLLLG